MSTIRDYIRYCTKDGGLWLYDQHMLGEWDDMPTQYKEDWCILFDMMLDVYVGSRTENIIEAIKHGLCPTRYDAWFWDAYGRHTFKTQWMVKKADKICPNGLPAFDWSPTHLFYPRYYGNAGMPHTYDYKQRESYLTIPIDDGEGDYWDRHKKYPSNADKRNMGINKMTPQPIWLFDNMADAWSFILRTAVDK
jgi:hypothetical protein